VPRQVVVFVVGGLTLPEIRAAHEAHGWNTSTDSQF
jgi:hypothetical protein